MDLLEEHFTVFTDHRTLTNFKKQKDLSRCQSRWQEEQAQYEFDIIYVVGELNRVADTLSRLLDDYELVMASAHATVHALKIATHPEWLSRIREGYEQDPWCR